MSRETADERERRLAREFAKAHKREFGEFRTQDRLRSSWLEERHEQGRKPGETGDSGNRVFDLDRFETFEQAEERLGLRPRREPVRRPEVEEAVTAIFRRLSPRDGQVLVSYYEQQCSLRELVQVLGLSEGSWSQARRAIDRALKHARDIARDLGITQAVVYGKVIDLPPTGPDEDVHVDPEAPDGLDG